MFADYHTKIDERLMRVQRLPEQTRMALFYGGVALFAILAIGGWIISLSVFSSSPPQSEMAQDSAGGDSFSADGNLGETFRSTFDNEENQASLESIREQIQKLEQLKQLNAQSDTQPQEQPSVAEPVAPSEQPAAGTQTPSGQ